MLLVDVACQIDYIHTGTTCRAVQHQCISAVSIHY